MEFHFLTIWMKKIKMVACRIKILILGKSRFLSLNYGIVDTYSPETITKLETQPRTPKPGTGHYIWCRPWRVRTFFFFLNSRKSHLPKTYYMGPGKRVKPRLSQALISSARPNSNLKGTYLLTRPTFNSLFLFFIYKKIRVSFGQSLKYWNYIIFLV